MNEYDFKNLNPLEFESLVNDLLSENFGTHVERFKPGRDQGIDGRFCHLDGIGIIQSKHRVVSGFRSLLSELTKNELPKVKKIAPSRYILATSVPFSPGEKEKILNGMAPFIKSTADIYGKDDLNALIRKYQNVAKTHYKLWIANSTVLRHFLNAANHNSSNQIVSEACQKSSSYVLTESHLLAAEMLSKNNVLVITGDPGVGKTTMAGQICLEYVDDKYEFIAINNDIEEGFSACQPDSKQIFYFDDFLGRNYLETLRFNEDARIMQFIRLISNSNNKKFILTSRTNILDQGYRLGQSFSTDKIKTKEFILDVTDYSNIDKAKILYNFLWNSDIKREFVEKVLHSKKYREIIFHKNYNPRLLEFITSNDYINLDAPDDYLRYIDDSLKNPKEVWDHPYSVQLDEATRTIIDLIVIGNGRVKEDALRIAYNNYIRRSENQYTSNISRDFDSVVNILSRSFIKRTISRHYGLEHGDRVLKDWIIYETFNPSISDFVLGKRLNDSRYIADLLLFYEGYEGILFLEKIKSFNPNFARNVALTLLNSTKDEAIARGKFFIMRLGNLLNDDEFDQYFSKYNLSTVTDDIISLGFIDEKILKFCSRIISTARHDDEQLARFYLSILEFETDYSELDYISSMLTSDVPEEYQDEIAEKYYPKLLDAWRYEILNNFVYENVDNFITWVGNEDDPDYVIDEDMLVTLITRNSGKLFTPIEANDASEMLDDIDLNDIVNDYFKTGISEVSMRGGDTSAHEDIDSIFEGFIAAKYS